MTTEKWWFLIFLKKNKKYEKYTKVCVGMVDIYSEGIVNIDLFNKNAT